MPGTAQLLDGLILAMRANPASDRTRDYLIQTCVDCLLYLDAATRLPLVSRVAGKEYFSFEAGGRVSRAVNSGLYVHSVDEPLRFLTSLDLTGVPGMTASEITRACYTIAMSFCCANDLQQRGDQQRPGTFFERFIQHVCTRRFGVLPRTRLDVLNLDMATQLPTDTIFDLGPNQPKYHVPVKTSTRERVIQVWAHQRVLDGVYGVGRFLGLLVCMAETKRDTQTLRVDEICLADQWRVYQLFIAQMRRIYYLDVPCRYAALNAVFPVIHVKEFGEFFEEAGRLAVEG